jgi:hypothetical protein
MVTADGGFAMRLTNNTGAASVKGSVMGVSAAVDNACILCPVNSNNKIGVMSSDGVANGGECWVVTSGIVLGRLADGQSATRGQYALISNTQAGRLVSSASLDEQYMLVGRFVESCGAGGLARLVLEVNSGT